MCAIAIFSRVSSGLITATFTVFGNVNLRKIVLLGKKFVESGLYKPGKWGADGYVISQKFLLTYLDTPQKGNN
jgi:hypothetical protein